MTSYVFTLPKPLVDDFKLRQLSLPVPEPVVQPAPVESSAGLGGLFTCSITTASFGTVEELKEHYKSDWYKYNLKLRSKGSKAIVSEDEFDRLVEGLSASISGSDSSASSAHSSSSSTNAVNRLLKAQPAAEHDNEFEGNLSGPRSALIWFEAPNAAPGTQYGIYRAVLPIAGAGKRRADGPEILKELRSLQLPEDYSLSAKALKAKTARVEAEGGVVSPEGSGERRWTLLMFGGGHFAGMVVSLVPKLVSKGKGKEKELEVVVREKKTFHRYTTRRKQGGSQAAHDGGGKGKASSAGAALRRYNETALTEDVQSLLTEWKDEINSSELIFLRASKTNYKTFFGYDGACMDKRDPRIRGFSFPTRRPTLSELTSAFQTLTRPRISHLSSSALAELDAAYIASLAPPPVPVAPKPKVVAPKVVVPKLSAEEELARDLWNRVLEMVAKGRLSALGPFLDKYQQFFEGERTRIGSVWGTLPEWREERTTTATLLHLAAKEDQAELVSYLLLERGADPTVAASILPCTSNGSTVPARGIPTPYELAPSRITRNVFRLLATSHPTLWNWTSSAADGARVPSALNIEKEEERERKAEVLQAKLREKTLAREAAAQAEAVAKREELERAEQAERDRLQLALLKKGGSNLAKKAPQRLGGGPSARIVQAGGAGGAGGTLSEADQMRVDRERRARAAEARFGQ